MRSQCRLVNKNYGTGKNTAVHEAKYSAVLNLSVAFEKPDMELVKRTLWLLRIC